VWQQQLHAASRLLSMLAKLLHRSQPVYLQQQMCLLTRTPSGKQSTASQGCSISLSCLNMTDQMSCRVEHVSEDAAEAAASFSFTSSPAN